jgi:hypothetical protein
VTKRLKLTLDEAEFIFWLIGDLQFKEMVTQKYGRPPCFRNVDIDKICDAIEALEFFK